MAAAAESDVTCACSCSNISIMQLFHELKQQFPAVPDRVVSECIRQNFHDKGTCEEILSRENQTYLLPSYPTSLKMSSGSIDPESPLSVRLHGEKCNINAGDYRNDNRFQYHHSDKYDTSASVCRNDIISANIDRSDSLSQYHHSEKCNVSASVSRSENRGQYHHSDKCNISTSVSRSDNRWQYHHAESSVISSRSEFSQGATSDTSAVEQFGNVNVRNSHFSTHRDSNSCLSQSDSNIPHTDNRVVPRSILFPNNVSRSNVNRELPSASHRPCIRPTSLNVGPSNPHQQTLICSAPVITSNFEPFHNIPTSTSDRPMDGRFSFPVTLSHGVYQHHRQSDSSINSCRQFAPQSSIQNPLMYSDNYEVNVNCSVQHTPVESQRIRSALQVQPVPHYWEGAASIAAVPPQQPRSYTSVNLTLRPPSSEPQPPIDIQTGPASLTYSTSSYDARGFRSDLQIRIGPGGAGSVSAMRMRPHNLPWSSQVLTQTTVQPIGSDHSVPLAMLTETMENSNSSQDDTSQDQMQLIDLEHIQSFTKALLEQQMERKNKLQRELQSEKNKLRAMQRDVRGMEKDLAQRQLFKSCPAPPALSTLQKVQKLCQEIHFLQEECKKMTQEVDINSDARVPLGETDEEFYKNIYTGQHGYVALRPGVDTPPNRSEPVREAGEGPHWTCTECTFRNHPLLDKCEQCEMPRIMLGSEPCYCHPGKLNPPSPLTLTLMVPPCQQT